MIVPTKQIEEAFNASGAGVTRSTATASQFAAKKSAAFGALVTSAYSQSFFGLFGIVVARQLKLVRRDKASGVGRVVQCLIMGILVGLLYLQLDKTLATGRSFLGVIFTSVMFLALGNAPQIGLLLKGRGVFYKHRDNLLYHGVSYCLAMTVTQTPVALLEVMFYTLPVYWMVGFHASIAGYLTMYVVCLCCSLGLAAFFRAIAAWSKNLVFANSILM